MSEVMYLEDEGVRAGIYSRLKDNPEGALLIRKLRRGGSFNDDHIDLVAQTAEVSRDVAAKYLADLVDSPITHPMPGMHGTCCPELAAS